MGSFLLFAALVFAQAPEKKPVSVSYEAVIRCYPELEDSSQSFRVDLGRLRERMDLLFPSLRSHMQLRTVKFRDNTGVDRRVRVEESPLGKGFSAIWETVGTDGLYTPWTESGVKAQGATLMQINAVLAKGSILSDERIDVDNRIKNLTLKTRRNAAKVVELRLEEAGTKKALNCEDKGEFGSICLCTKKPPPLAPAGK